MCLLFLLPAASSIFPNFYVCMNEEVPGDDRCKAFSSWGSNADCVASALPTSSDFARAVEMIKLCKQDRVTIEKSIYSGFCGSPGVSVLLSQRGVRWHLKCRSFPVPSSSKVHYELVHLGTWIFFNPFIVCLNASNSLVK